MAWVAIATNIKICHEISALLKLFKTVKLNGIVCAAPYFMEEVPWITVWIISERNLSSCRHCSQLMFYLPPKVFGVNSVKAYLMLASQNGRKTWVPMVPLSCVEVVKWGKYLLPSLIRNKVAERERCGCGSLEGISISCLIDTKTVESHSSPCSFFSLSSVLDCFVLALAYLEHPVSQFTC